MIGEKIKRRREQLGLSQQQLAGTEMTRAFISLLENGRCSPSPESIRIIAKRLDKSPEYFLEGTDGQTVQSVQVLLRNAQRALENSEIDDALVQLAEAINMSRRTERMDLEAQALSLHGDCLRRQGQFLEAMDIYETALDCYKILGNRAGIARSYFDLGNCAFRAEELTLARRFYVKLVRVAEGAKSLQEYRNDGYLYLGTVLYRLGELAPAASAFEDCLAECQQAAWPRTWAEAAMGLGCVYLAMERYAEARTSCQTAEEVFRRLKHPRMYEVHHNLAHLEMAEQHWEHAYSILHQCLAAYRELQLYQKQASALEDIAHYWRHKQQFDKAATALQDALDLLDLQDDGILRGRIYRQLGIVEAKLNHQERAHNHLLISYELLRRVKASEEARITLEELRKLTAGETIDTNSETGGPL